MNKIVLYCKSYRQDALRVRKLAETVARFNRETLPFYVSAPPADQALFAEKLAGVPHSLLDDDAILRANPRLDLARVNAMPGYRSQQVVKSEFWRLGLAENYLCLDSDSYFIRDFTQRDFIADSGDPYTVMHEGKEFLRYLASIGKQKYVDHAAQEQRRFGEQFPGVDTRWRFGPTPVIWSAKVWRALDEQKLKPAGETFADAIERFPSELHWYGGSLLSFKPIAILPREPLFRLYGYAEEYWRAQKMGETDETLKAKFLGVTRQSAWDKDADLQASKRWRRAVRRFLKYHFGRW